MINSLIKLLKVTGARVMPQLGFVVCLLLVSLQAWSVSRADLIKSVNAFYDWANATYGEPGAKPPAPVELKENLNRVFAVNVIHRLNGKIVARGIGDLYQRFMRLRNKYQDVVVQRPFKEVVVDRANHKVAIRYDINFHLKEGGRKKIHALTIFKVDGDGKLSEFNEISSVELDHLN